MNPGKDCSDHKACTLFYSALTWKERAMGGRAHGFFSFVVATSTTSARNVCSIPPGNLLIFHTCRFQKGMLCVKAAPRPVLLLPCNSLTQALKRRGNVIPKQAFH